MNHVKLQFSLIELIFIFVLLLTLINVKGQQIVNVRAIYINDTLSITYDLSGKVNLDSLGIKIVARTTKNVYNQVFKGDNQKGILPGKGKNVNVILSRDFFPDKGESLKIQLLGWSENNTKVRKGKSRFLHAFSKPPKNPRFSLISSAGIILPSSEFSDIGFRTSVSFFYNPSPLFKVGIGIENLTLNDTLYPLYTYPYFINLIYELPNQPSVYTLMKLGYSWENRGPVVSLGGGFYKILKGPFGVDLGVSLHKFFGNRDFVALSLDAGLSLNVSSRYRFKSEKVYKFRKYLLYAETGINYLQKPTPNLSFEIAYNILPFYTQGIGISYESVNYEGTYKIYRPYYSTYYKNYKQFIISEQPYIIRYKIVPLYLSGRLFFTSSKLRPFLQWKYGLSLFSDVNEGSLANGFMAGSGLGIQVSFNKSSAIIFSSGLKFFKNEHSHNGSTNYYFGSFYINTGMVF